MRLIEALLLWEGGISNERVHDLPDCPSVHASRLLAAYQRQFPGRLSEGTTLSEYGAGGHIRAVLTNGTAREYLHLVEAAPSAQVSRVQTNYSLFEPSLFRVLHRPRQKLPACCPITRHSRNQPSTDPAARIPASGDRGATAMAHPSLEQSSRRIQRFRPRPDPVTAGNRYWRQCRRRALKPATRITRQSGVMPGPALQPAAAAAREKPGQHTVSQSSPLHDHHRPALGRRIACRLGVVVVEARQHLAQTL